MACELPCAQVEFHASTWFEEETKHPAGTPLYAVAAANSSGYVAAITFYYGVSRDQEQAQTWRTVIMAPELLPVTNTLLASPLYFWSVYMTMLAMEFESPCYRQPCRGAR